MNQPLPTFQPVNETEDIEFTRVIRENGEPETLRLDLYQPINAVAGSRPLVIWFHGGGFAVGNDKRQQYIPLLARAFANKGYVGVAPDYRVRKKPAEDWQGSVRDAVADGRAALAWALNHCAEYSIDPQRVVLAGGSAGAMLALNLTASLPPGVIRAVLNLWGTPLPEARLFGAPNPDFPPTFIVHGTADKLVPYDLSAAFVGELASAGVRHELLTLPDAPHTPLDHIEMIIKASAHFLEGVLEDQEA